MLNCGKFEEWSQFLANGGIALQLYRTKKCKQSGYATEQWAGVVSPVSARADKSTFLHSPLAGVEGLFIQAKPRKGVLVLSIDLLQRSIAIEVDYASIAPV